LLRRKTKDKSKKTKVGQGVKNLQGGKKKDNRHLHKLRLTKKGVRQKEEKMEEKKNDLCERLFEFAVRN
jgi:hypothetical protein